jgi:hypothetical protein
MSLKASFGFSASIKTILRFYKSGDCKQVNFFKSNVMKRNSMKHLLIVAVLMGVFLFSLIQLANARKSPPPVKFLVATFCCDGGLLSGFANDCDEGQGSCIDHHCEFEHVELRNESCFGR